MKECFIKLEENEIGIVKLIINNSSSKNALNPIILNEITANLKNLKRFLQFKKFLRLGFRQKINC